MKPLLHRTGNCRSLAGTARLQRADPRDRTWYGPWGSYTLMAGRCCCEATRAGKKLSVNCREGFLPAELQAANAQAPNASPQTIWGYYLPYVKGIAHKLEGPVLHFHDYPPLGYPSCKEEYCHYAYDFTDTGHFPLVAARAGTVVSSRDSCVDGNTYCTNYIILQDVVGGAYQIYLHLAYGTVPNHLVPGVYVGRGTYIGDTDDTGYSTSEHVHFMVVTSFWYGGDGYPWGRSVDARFTDVTINNGIPRTCYEVTHLPIIYDGATECSETS